MGNVIFTTSICKYCKNLFYDELMDEYTCILYIGIYVTYKSSCNKFKEII